MRVVSKRTMTREYTKLAWRIAFVGFNRKGEVQYNVYSKKEGLKENPEMEYSIAGCPIKQKGIL